MLKIGLLLRKFMSPINSLFSLKLLSIPLVLSLTSCHHTPAQFGEIEKRYDFDHQVHYRQVQYNDNKFAIRIIADSYEAFTRQSVFLLRHSRHLCNRLVPQLTLKNGIQRFEKLPTEPRPYQPDLYAEIECIAP